MNGLFVNFVSIGLGIFITYAAGSSAIYLWKGNIRKAKKDGYNKADPVEAFSDQLGLNVAAMGVMFLFGLGLFIFGVISFLNF